MRWQINGNLLSLVFPRTQKGPHLKMSKPGCKVIAARKYIRANVSKPICFADVTVQIVGSLRKRRFQSKFDRGCTGAKSVNEKIRKIKSLKQQYKKFKQGVQMQNTTSCPRTKKGTQYAPSLFRARPSTTLWDAGMWLPYDAITWASGEVITQLVIGLAVTTWSTSCPPQWLRWERHQLERNLCPILAAVWNEGYIREATFDTGCPATQKKPPAGGGRSLATHTHQTDYRYKNYLFPLSLIYLTLWLSFLGPLCGIDSINVNFRLHFILLYTLVKLLFD